MQNNQGDVNYISLEQRRRQNLFVITLVSDVTEGGVVHFLENVTVAWQGRGGSTFPTFQRDVIYGWPRTAFSNLMERLLKTNINTINIGPLPLRFISDVERRRQQTTFRVSYKIFTYILFTDYWWRNSSNLIEWLGTFHLGSLHS